MARHDGELKAVREAAPSDVFGTNMTNVADDRLRQEAITCYLSASDGWRDAIKLLRGAFAPEEQRRESELTRGKAD